MGELSLPVGDGEEDSHDQGGEHLQVIRVQAQPQHDLHDQVVDDGAQGDTDEVAKAVKAIAKVEPDCSVIL